MDNKEKNADEAMLLIKKYLPILTVDQLREVGKQVDHFLDFAEDNKAK